jgi:hypothetical protein
MIPFPRNEIHDEDAALAWWADQFASACERLNVQCNAASLTREFVASLREIREASLDAALSLTEAADETGYSAKQVSRWLKAGQIENAGTPTAPRVRRRDIVGRKKSLLPSRPGIAILASAQDIARSVAHSNRSSDG